MKLKESQLYFPQREYKNRSSKGVPEELTKGKGNQKLKKTSKPGCLLPRHATHYIFQIPL